MGGFEWFKGSKCHGSSWEMTIKIIEQGKYWVGNVAVLIKSVEFGLMESRKVFIICKIIELWKSNKSRKKENYSLNLIQAQISKSI